VTKVRLKSLALYIVSSGFGVHPYFSLDTVRLRVVGVLSIWVRSWHSDVSKTIK
jgi:hypothetical protein